MTNVPELQQRIMIRAIETGNLAKIIKVATYFNDTRVLNMLKAFKYTKIESKHLESLNVVVIKGEL